MDFRKAPTHFWVLVFLYALSVFFFLSTRIHEPVKQSLASNKRQILSITQGLLAENLQDAHVLKILTPEGIWIEVYDKNAEGLTRLIDKILITDRHDAYIQFQGRSLNLALKDMDGLKGFEIIAPTYTTSLVPKLNIFRFDAETKSLQPYVN